MDDPVLRTVGPIVAVLGVSAACLPIAIAVAIVGLTIGAFGIPMTTRYYRKQIRARNWGEVRRLERGVLDMANRGKNVGLMLRKFEKIRREEGLDY